MLKRILFLVFFVSGFLSAADQITKEVSALDYYQCVLKHGVEKCAQHLKYPGLAYLTHSALRTSGVLSPGSFTDYVTGGALYGAALAAAWQTRRDGNLLLDYEKLNDEFKKVREMYQKSIENPYMIQYNKQLLHEISQRFSRLKENGFLPEEINDILDRLIRIISDSDISIIDGLQMAKDLIFNKKNEKDNVVIQELLIFLNNAIQEQSTIVNAIKIPDRFPIIKINYQMLLFVISQIKQDLKHLEADFKKKKLQQEENGYDSDSDDSNSDDSNSDDSNSDDSNSDDSNSDDSNSDDSNSDDDDFLDSQKDNFRQQLDFQNPSPQLAEYPIGNAFTAASVRRETPRHLRAELSPAAGPMTQILWGAQQRLAKTRDQILKNRHPEKISSPLLHHNENYQRPSAQAESSNVSPYVHYSKKIASD